MQTILINKLLNKENELKSISIPRPLKMSVFNTIQRLKTEISILKETLRECQEHKILEQRNLNF